MIDTVGIVEGGSEVWGEKRTQMLFFLSLDENGAIPLLPGHPLNFIEQDGLPHTTKTSE